MEACVSVIVFFHPARFRLSSTLWCYSKVMASTLLSPNRDSPLFSFPSNPLCTWRRILFAFSLIHIHSSGVSSHGEEWFNWALDIEAPEWQVEEVDPHCSRHYWPWAAFLLFQPFCSERENLLCKITCKVIEYQLATLQHCCVHLTVCIQTSQRNGEWRYWICKFLKLRLCKIFIFAHNYLIIPLNY